MAARGLEVVCASSALRKVLADDGLEPKSEPAAASSQESAAKEGASAVVTTETTEPACGGPWEALP